MPEAGGCDEQNPAGYHDFTKGGLCSIQPKPASPETVVIEEDESVQGLGSGSSHGSAQASSKKAKGHKQIAKEETAARWGIGRPWLIKVRTVVTIYRSVVQNSCHNLQQLTELLLLYYQLYQAGGAGP
jgi:hypothetical protein